MIKKKRKSLCKLKFKGSVNFGKKKAEKYDRCKELMEDGPRFEDFQISSNVQKLGFLKPVTFTTNVNLELQVSSIVVSPGNTYF